VRIVALFFVGYFALGIVLYVWPPEETESGKEPRLFQLYKDLMPLVIAVPAAYLGYCFQRRGSYLQALRELWKVLIPAVQRAIQYTYLDTPDRKEFANVMRDLSTVIDSLRGVFRNIPRRDNAGLYPYEPLKDIWQVMSWLRDERGAEQRRHARHCIRRLWHEVHSAMLTEFDREVPVHPVSKHLDGSKSLADKLRDGTLSDSDFR